MNFVKKGIAVATGTASSRRSFIGDDGRACDVKEKVTLHIKSTSSKDALTIAKLAIRTAQMSKKNEQGSWQKRFVCMVPHMFLYYYDNELSESPRGVIDLEYFTQLSVDADNVMTMSAREGIPLRAYYFQVSDPEVIAEFSSSLHRDRYQLIKDERDAYQQLQDQFSGEMDYASKMIESSSKDNEKMQVMILI